MEIRPTRQAGMMMIEALVGILIFSLGILALVGLQATTVSSVADAQYRVEAVNMTNQLLSQIWTNVDRTSEQTVRDSLQQFEHNATGNAETCAFSGDASVHPVVTSWTSLASAHGLPGVTGARQQVVVNTALNNLVMITVCWQAPSETSPHRHTVVANVN
ncbi:MAG: type IV pilus modification protein PilV [Burkholderiales bacterium]